MGDFFIEEQKMEQANNEHVTETVSEYWVYFYFHHLG